MSTISISELRVEPPFVRAEAMTRCFLYWAPHDFQKASSRVSRWFTEFFDCFVTALAKESNLTAEYFLHIGVLKDEWHYKFVKNAPKLMPMAGMGITPGVPLPAAPSEKTLQPIIKREKKFVAEEWLPPYVYWLLDRSHPVRKEFFTSGGVSLLFLPPNPSPFGAYKIPPVARKMVPGMNVDAIMEQMQALQSPFIKKSKELFGKPYEDLLGYEGWLFMYPLFLATHFFSLPETEVAKLLELTPVYVNESPSDKGVLIASKDDLTPLLNAIVSQLKQSGLEFPGSL